MTQPLDRDQETPEARSRRLDDMVKSLVGIDEVKENLKSMLNRRKRPSIVFTGEPGVGKTKMFNDLAKKTAEGDAPQKIISIDLSGIMDHARLNDIVEGLVSGKPLGLRLGEQAAQACHDGLPQSITPMKPLQLRRGFYSAI
jgi:stage III sporulation protein SpoIIIAA